MDRFRVTGDELRNFYPVETKLSRVFGQIEKELQQEGRVVCRFVVNGLDLSEKDEHRFAEMTLNEVQTLEYLSESKSTLTREVLKGWIQSVPELTQAAEELSSRILAGKSEGLIKSVHDLVENFEFLLGSAIAILKLEGRKDPEAEAGPLIESTQSAISEAVRHLEKRDFVQLAQVIEYDFTHHLEVWRKTFLDLLAQGEAQGGDRDGESQEDNPLGRRKAGA